MTSRDMTPSNAPDGDDQVVQHPQRLRLFLRDPSPPPRRSAQAQPSKENLEKYGSKSLALDIEEFPATWPVNLEPELRELYGKIRKLLIRNREPVGKEGKPFGHPRSLSSRLCRYRQVLRMLIQQSQGRRGRFDIASGRVNTARRVNGRAKNTAGMSAYALAQPTQPLSATLQRVSSPAFLPRYNHSLTVIGGRAHIFGGETEDGKLAGGEVHIVTLPLGRKREKDGEVDYKCVPSLGEGEDGSVPEPRSGHTACAIGERMYVYGGKGSNGNPIEEAGRVWVFDTNTLGWSHIDPSSADSIPAARYLHSCAASSRPLPQQNAPANASYTAQIQSTIGKLPSLIGKGASPQEPHGTIIIHGGITSSTKDILATDTYAFNVITHTWTPLPPSPSASSSPSTPTTMALANETLYTVTTSRSSSDLGSELHTLPLDTQTFTDSRGSSDLALTASKESWTTTPFPTNPLTPGPRGRKGAGLVPVTTGNGRVYLLLFMGERVASSSSSSTAAGKANHGEKGAKEEITAEYWSDIFSYQVPSARSTAAGIKDATRSALGFSSGEGTWAEVKVDAGEEIAAAVEAGGGGGKAEAGGSGGKAHPGPRGWFACSAVEGGRVVLWGGKNGKGEVEGDGWLLGIKMVG